MTLDKPIRVGLEHLRAEQQLLRRGGRCKLVDYEFAMGRLAKANQAPLTSGDVQFEVPSYSLRGGEAHAVINAQAGVWPAPHLVSRLPVDFAFLDEQPKDVVLPNVEQQLLVDPGEALEHDVKSNAPTAFKGKRPAVPNHSPTDVRTGVYSVLSDVTIQYCGRED